ncbi:MAG TPA: AAA family ATPase [Vicinamibacterales bacterium]|nr:AAA family ATPase [Vicinamibacterales bacterium]
MYLRFFDLREPPFELTPNARFLFLTPRHREALSSLQYGLGSAKAVTVLVGEAGTGKTTLLRAALESDRCRHVRCVYLHNPALTRGEFVEILSRQIGLSARAAQSKAALLTELEAVLRERRAAGQIVALVVDEAQSLSDELLEEIRLLANMETATEKLLPLVLSGQPEFGDRLATPGLRQLKQRVALRCEIGPFTLQETAAYIATRIRIAGGEAARLFTREAVMLVHERSGGIARTISVICDNALVTAFALGRRPVDREIVLEVCRDFDLRAAPGAPPVSAAPAEAPAEPAGAVGDEMRPESEQVASIEHRRAGVLGLR